MILKELATDSKSERQIDSGAELTARDAEGKSAVERARQQGHHKLSQVLVRSARL